MFTGSIKKTVTVAPYDITEKKVAAGSKKMSISFNGNQNVPFAYSKEGTKPSMVVMYDGTVLREGVDYTLSYKNNRKPFYSYEHYRKAKASQYPDVIVKGKGDFTGTVSGNYFFIGKADVEDTVELRPNDVVFNAKGKDGYYRSAPRFFENGKLLSVGRGKDIESVSDVKYYYTSDTYVQGKRLRSAGSMVKTGDVIPENTMLKVTATVVCGNSSNYSSDSKGTVLTGYFSIIPAGRDISKATVKVVGNPSYNNSNEVVIKKSDLKVTLKVSNKETLILKEGEYEIVSIKNNKLLGTATVTIRGKSRKSGIDYYSLMTPLEDSDLRSFGGTKTFTFRIGARSMR